MSVAKEHSQGRHPSLPCIDDYNVSFSAIELAQSRTLSSIWSQQVSTMRDTIDLLCRRSTGSRNPATVFRILILGDGGDAPHFSAVV
jgi:hypothetical protein